MAYHPRDLVPFQGYVLRIFRHLETSFSDFYSIFTTEVQVQICTVVNGSQIFLVNISHFSASHMQIQPYHLPQPCITKPSPVTYTGLL